MKFILYNPITHLFDFFVEALIYEFEKRKIEYTFEYQNNKLEDIILILINPHFFYENTEINKRVKDISKKYKYKILYISEPINFIVEKKVYMELINIIKPYTLWTYTNSNLNVLNTYLKVFKIFPFYNRKYDFTNKTINSITNTTKKSITNTITNTNNTTKNINNIVFIGNINTVRENTCNILFKDYLINFKDKWLKEDWKEILNNYLFYLNIHRRNNCLSFETFRIIPILANGGVIFSEHCNKEEEEIYSKYNIIFCNKEDLLESFINYKKNIDYDKIIEKTENFKKEINKYFLLDEYIQYHEKL